MSFEVHVNTAEIYLTVISINMESCTSFQDVLLTCINDRLVENGYTPWTGYPIKKGVKDPRVIETALRVCKEFSNHDSQRLQTILTICHDLHITQKNVHVACSSICEGGMHWSKFVAILLFASIMAVECCNKNDASQINYIIDWTSEFVCTHIMEWMNKNGDWAGFVEQFATRATTSWISLFYAVRDVAIGKLTLKQF